MITLSKISKRFENNWIFKEISYTFEMGGRYAILGNNGTGKSTLMRCLAQMHTINKGDISYTYRGKKIAPELFYKYYSFCAPGIDLIDEMTLEEFLRFHFSFKSRLQDFSIDHIIQKIELKHFAKQQIRNFSSGMKQRVKLGQALFSDTPFIFLDEPCTNLDQKGVELYQHLLATTSWLKERLLIIASNDETEYPGADNFLNLNDHLHQHKLMVE